MVMTEAPAGIGRPAGLPGGSALTIPTERLPRIGDAPAADPGAAAASPDSAAEAPARALDRFAAPFENPSGRPLLGVILIDLGDQGIDRAALATLPFPVTFAIPAGRPDAAAAAAAHRAAGYEVVILAEGLPAGATAADIEVAFGAFLAAVPEAVAVLDAPEGGFQGDRTAAGQVAMILADTGHGLILHDRGLNTAAQLAARAGVPAALVFRDLDRAGENPSTIRRYLDRAVFKAGQEGRVLVLGRTRPETVTAIFSWAMEGRAETVAFAPVSAFLRGE
jgi:hypothetical protein